MATKVFRYSADDNAWKAADGSTVPETTSFTCDTTACIAYMHEVNARSTALTEAFAQEIEKADKGIANLTKEQQLELTQLALTWENAKRSPWLKDYPEHEKNCGSVFPGPCRESINYAAQHDGDVSAFNKKLEAITGRKTGIEPSKRKEPDKKKDGSLFSFGGGFGGVGTGLAVGAVAVLAFIATRK